MERATSNSLPLAQQPDGSLPATIHVSPSQHLAQLPIAALLAFVPRLHTTYRVLNRNTRASVATGRTYYRLRLGTGQTLYISDNLLDLVRLIDGRRSIQALSDALANSRVDQSTLPRSSISCVASLCLGDWWIFPCH